MPLFEYACRGCGQHFEAFVTADRPAACPGCQGADLQKLLSSPGMVGTGGRRETRSHSSLSVPRVGIAPVRTGPRSTDRDLVIS